MKGFVQMNKALKRMVDIVISGSAMLVLLPFFALIAICIKLDSRGPVFFLQGRRTQHGRVFMMLKFRSMVVTIRMIPGLQRSGGSCGIAVLMSCRS